MHYICSHDKDRNNEANMIKHHHICSRERNHLHLVSILSFISQQLSLLDALIPGSGLHWFNCPRYISNRFKRLSKITEKLSHLL